MMAYRIDIAELTTAILPGMTLAGLEDEYSVGADFLVESALVMAPASGVFILSDSKDIYYFSTVTRAA